MSASVAILDYGMGNLGSVANMVRHVGGEAKLCSQPGQVKGHSKIILPGVGHFAMAMRRLRNDGWSEVLEQARANGAWIFGICLGMQLMTLGSEEGDDEGLGWFQLQTKRFPQEAANGRRVLVPHMGWNQALAVDAGFTAWTAVDSPGRFYFVHSFYVDGAEDSTCWAATEYGGVLFASGIQLGRLWGTQFHPEKSHSCGMALMGHFLRQD